MEITLECRDVTGNEPIMFRESIMSSKEHDPPITVTQSVNGAYLFVRYGERSYLVRVEDIAVAVVEQARELAPFQT